jgi:hypothetical protein
LYPKLSIFELESEQTYENKYGFNDIRSYPIRLHPYPQPLLEDYEALGLYDDFQSDGDVDGDCNEQWVSDGDNSLDSNEINDGRLSHMNEREMCINVICLVN